MHAYKKALLSVALSFLLPFSAMSADDDGTFTITIQGPEVEDTAPQVQPVQPVRRTPVRRATPRQNRQAPVNATATRTPSATVNQQPQTVRSATTATTTTQAQQTPARTYTVSQGDTIWSVAHRYLPQDRSVNEFQIVASIYRNNRGAFGQGNVNNLLRTTITIPPVSEIARETTDTGSKLLASGSMTLPPLGNAPVAANTANTTTPATITPTSQRPMQTLSDSDIPQYTATETKIKKLQEEEAKKDLSVAMPENTRGADLDKNQATEQTVSTDNSQTNANNPKQASVKAMSADLAAAAVDAQSIRIMLDGNKKAIDEKTKVLEQQLAEAMDRMKKTSAATAKTAADSVSTLASQYDNIISGLQQDIIEIKGNISKLSQDNDRMREMLLANDEKIEDMQLQLSQFSVSTPASVVDLDKPVMMILFGAGLLALVLMIIFLIIKLKSRASAKMTDDFDVEDDFSSDDTLLSDENGSIDLEAPVSGEDEPEVSDVPQKEQDKNNNSINSPSDTASDVEAALNEKKQADAETAAPEEQAAPAENNAATDNFTATDDGNNQKDAAQEAWDNAATTNSADESKDDKAVMDEWSKALDEQSGNEQNVDLGQDENKDTSQDDMASAWEAALNEQENAEKKDDSAKSDDEAMADAWSAALNEQKEAEEKASDDKTDDKANTPKSEEEAMADAWSAALNEQNNAEQSNAQQNQTEEKSEDKASAPKSEEEAMADAWSAALNEQSNAEQNQTESQPSEDEVSEEPAADIPTDETVADDKSEAKANTPKSEAEAIAEAMSKARDDNGSDTADNTQNATPDVAESDTDNVDIDSIVDDANANVADKTTETAPDATTSTDDVADTIPTDDVKVEDVSEDELLNGISENTDKILEENHVAPENLDVSAENTTDDTASNADTDNVAADDTEVPQDTETSEPAEASAEENSTKEEDPQEQLSGEEKAFLESMSDKSNSDTATDNKDTEIDPEFDAEPSEQTQDNIPDANADVVPQDEIPANKSVGSNVDEVLNDDLNLEDLLNGNDNVVDAPEEAETPEEQAQGVESFDAIPEDEENLQEHTIDEEPDSDSDSADSDDTESSDTETVDAEPISSDDNFDSEDTEPEFEESEPVDNTDDTEIEEAQESPVEDADFDTEVENNNTADGVSDDNNADDIDVEDTNVENTDDNNDIGDIQSKSEQEIFNNDTTDDNSKDENGVVSWAVPDDDFDIVGQGKDADATVSNEPVSETSGKNTKEAENTDTSDVENTKAQEQKTEPQVADTDDSSEDAQALDDLEQRLSASKAQYDTGADEDIMNMLSGGVHDDLPHESEKAFTDDEIASMMSSANAVDPKSIPEDNLALDEPVEEKVTDTDTSEDHSLENVADTIGPISSDSDDYENGADNLNSDGSDNFDGLNAKQHQYYVDELNLARLYFETGDTEEALKIIDDVKENGSSDLKEEASKIIETYGN